MLISLVIFFVFLVIFIPQSIKINIHITCDNLFTNVTTNPNLKNNIVVKLFNILPVYKKNLFVKKKDKKNTAKNNDFVKTVNKISTIKKLMKKIRYDEFVLSLGFNTDDYIANSYINASLNTLLCMYINANQYQFNMKKLYYQTYIADHLVVLNFESIIRISIADTMSIILKEYFKVKKSKKKLLVFERSKYYGNTSN